MATAFPRPTPAIQICGREKEVEKRLSCVDRWPSLSVKRHHRPHLPRGGAVARMAIAICAPATDAADNREATCVTLCFIHQADCNVFQGSGVSALWKILSFVAASSCRLTRTYWNCKPHFIPLISLPLRLTLCMSVTPSCLPLHLLPSLLLFISLLLSRSLWRFL